MAGSRTEKHTAVYRNVKRCEFHNIGDWGKLKSGAGYISLGYTEKLAGTTANAPQDTSYRVKINTAVLNVRKGPGTNYPVTTQVKQGEVYTIVGEEKNGNTTWGKLKSGAGYISLGYTQRA